MRLPAVALAILCAAIPAAAQQPPLVTDRPDFTESPVAVTRLQLEGGYTLSRGDGAAEHALGELLVRVPVAPRLELRLGLNSHLWTRAADGEWVSGFQDASIGAKLALTEFEPVRPAAALLVGTTLPTGAAPFGEDGFQPEAKLALAWPLSARAGLSSNLNYAYASEGGERYHRFAGSLSLGYALTERLGSYVELFGFAPEAPGSSSVAYANGGFTFGLAEDLQLDLRAGLELASGAPAHFVGVGVAWRR